MRAPRDEQPAENPQRTDLSTIPATSRTPMDDLSSIVKQITVPVITLFGWFAGALPPLAALASIAWIVYQWYHSAPQVARRNANKARKSARSRK